MNPDRSLRDRIQALKAERGAVILAHNYQLGEVQDIADHTGDSLELSRIAAKTDAKVIVFCGVHFMAETAKILSPEKTVLIPDPKAVLPDGRYDHGSGAARVQGHAPGTAGGGLCKHERGGKGGEHHLLHFGERGAGSRVAGCGCRAVRA